MSEWKALAARATWSVVHPVQESAEPPRRCTPPPPMFLCCDPKHPKWFPSFSCLRIAWCVLSSLLFPACTAAMSSCKRKAISLEQKAAILEAVSKGEKKGDVAARFAISQSTLSTILNAKDVILSSAKCGTSAQRKRLKTATYQDVDKAVFSWFMDASAQNVPQKAKDFACLLDKDFFKASSGFLHRFKAVYEIVGRVLCREYLESDGAVPDGVTLDDFLYGDSCVVATEEVTDDSIMQDVLGNTQEDPGSDTDAEDVEAPSNREVLDGIDVLRRYASSTGQHDAMQSLWAYERTVRPHLMSNQMKKKVTDYFQRK
ncbi:hypothetical protein HPB48_004869 [Haemaphysalis longicornis]|uniref:HTH psq-type domain-containing protein n=1 Tax=Haemaphysalis longicornis TaxID=44386 RepID=A0A9J6GSI2_HAELO|nr:hypothetical protein HPB48_004869 [Haemaphysalis longicornis]